MMVVVLVVVMRPRSGPSPVVAAAARPRLRDRQLRLLMPRQVLVLLLVLGRSCVHLRAPRSRVRRRGRLVMVVLVVCDFRTTRAFRIGPTVYPCRRRWRHRPFHAEGVRQRRDGRGCNRGRRGLVVALLLLWAVPGGVVDGRERRR